MCDNAARLHAGCTSWNRKDVPYDTERGCVLAPILDAMAIRRAID